MGDSSQAGAFLVSNTALLLQILWLKCVVYSAIDSYLWILEVSQG